MFPKWLVAGLGGLLMFFVAILIVQKLHDVSQSFKNERPTNTISVSGMGKVSAIPDLASVNIGVLSQGTTASDVKNKNNEAVNKVVAFIKAQGIADKDIKTADLSLQPQYDYSSGGSQPKITGYQQTQTVMVKVHNVNKDNAILDKILDGAVNNGANQIYGVNFSVEDPSGLQNQAKKMAIDDAKSKAQELAKQAGLTLGKVVSISEAGGGYPGPIMYGSPMSAGFGGGGDMKSVAPDIQGGSQEITETMNITYEVK